MTTYAKQLTCALSAVAITCFAQTDALAKDPNTTYSLGVEGFYDNYKEPDVTVDSTAYYGSLTGSVSHDWNKFFAALDGRASYGENDYKSDSGTSSGIPQWEFEVRPRVGLTFKTGSGAFSPYTGLGMTYFRDDGKGVVTNLNKVGYDRRIVHIYLPVGFTYAFQTSGGWSIAPNLEYDQLLWGHVSTRLSNVGLPVNIVNEQTQGWGVRGSLMFGKSVGNWSWQAGPFFRYLDVADSDITEDGGQFWLEPHNKRLQAGLQLRALW